MSKILVINSGSSSLKFTLFQKEALRSCAKGLIEEIGRKGGQVTLKSGENEPLLREKRATTDHREALFLMADILKKCSCLKEEGELFAIGHRVVHGGERFKEPTVVDSSVIEEIRRLFDLAPLHNPPNLTGIEVSLKAFPGVPQVAVFDTAFHQTMPKRAWCYGIPLEFYKRHKIRRYGFHGTSHSYVSSRVAEYLGRGKGDISIISLHLGNGASACAIKNGMCIDTSMGFTPLEGLLMGTRSGDLDPSIVIYLIRELGYSPGKVEEILNKKSGLLGLCGQSDMRQIVEGANRGDEDMVDALDSFCYRIKKYIGAYAASLGGLDALIFTGGIGENSSVVRKRVCQGLDFLGIKLDDGLNEAPIKEDIKDIKRADSRVSILVVKTDEELEIARQTLNVLKAN